MKMILKSLDRLQALVVSNGKKKVLTLEEAAEYSGLSKSYLYKLTSTHKISHYKPNGKLIYFDRDELDSWLLRNRITCTDELEEQAIDYVNSKNLNR